MVWLLAVLLGPSCRSHHWWSNGDSLQQLLCQSSWLYQGNVSGLLDRNGHVMNCPGRQWRGGWPWICSTCDASCMQSLSLQYFHDLGKCVIGWSVWELFLTLAQVLLQVAAGNLGHLVCSGVASQLMLTPSVKLGMFSGSIQDKVQKNPDSSSSSSKNYVLVFRGQSIDRTLRW